MPSPGADVPTKACRVCGLEKPLAEYYGSTSYRDGYYSACKMCHRATTRQRIKGLTPRERRIEQVAAAYRISHAAATVLVDARQCRICGTVADRLEIDHCHRTGRVRGALCRRCNLGIAFFDDDPAWLINATAYVWPLPEAKAAQRVYITEPSTQPGLWADERDSEDLFVSHGEWSA